MNMDKVHSRKRIFVAGHQGMVGGAICRILSAHDGYEIITCQRSQLDLTRQSEVEAFFRDEPIDEIYMAAAKVGGIYANATYPADFLYQNLMIETNVIHSAFRAGVKRLLFLGSSCIYPKNAQQPMPEEALLTGSLEQTNEPYAVAKIAGIKLCEAYTKQYGCEFDIDFRSVMPTNLYGPGDNYDLETSHVIPALIRKIHEAKTNGHENVVLWGTGSPKREFLYVDDLAAACVTVMSMTKSRYDRLAGKEGSHINVGSGLEITINQLASLIKKLIGYDGTIVFDDSYPDGSLQKLLDSTKIRASGWEPNTDLKEGLRLAYEEFLTRRKLNVSS